MVVEISVAQNVPGSAQFGSASLFVCAVAKGFAIGSSFFVPQAQKRAAPSFSPTGTAADSISRPVAFSRQDQRGEICMKGQRSQFDFSINRSVYFNIVGNGRHKCDGFYEHYDE